MKSIITLKWKICSGATHIRNSLKQNHNKNIKENPPKLIERIPFLLCSGAINGDSTKS